MSTQTLRCCLTDGVRRCHLFLKLPFRPHTHTQCLYLRIIISHCICIYIYCNAQWAQLPVCVSCAGRRRRIWRSCEAPQACTLQPAVFLFFVFCTLVYLLGERLLCIALAVFVCWFACIVYLFDLLCVRLWTQ